MPDLPTHTKATIIQIRPLSYHGPLLWANTLAYYPEMLTTPFQEKRKNL